MHQNTTGEYSTLCLVVGCGVEWVEEKLGRIFPQQYQLWLSCSVVQGPLCWMQDASEEVSIQLSLDSLALYPNFGVCFVCGTIYHPGTLTFFM